MPKDTSDQLEFARATQRFVRSSVLKTCLVFAICLGSMYLVTGISAEVPTALAVIFWTFVCGAAVSLFYYGALYVRARRTIRRLTGPR